MKALWRLRPQIDAKQAVWLGPACDRAVGVRLGTLAELAKSGMPTVWLSTAKEHVVAIVGKRGSGKSFTLGVIAEGLCVRPAHAEGIFSGVQNRAVLLFDPLDVYWTTRYPVGPSENEEVHRHYLMAEQNRVANREYDVEAWVPGSQHRRTNDPSWFQTLLLPVSSLGPDDWEGLLSLNLVAEPMGQCLADAIGLARNSGYTVGGKFVAGRRDLDLDDILAAAGSIELSGVYHPETVRAVRQRIHGLKGLGLFDRLGTTVQNLLHAGRLTVVMLGRLSQSYRVAVVSILTRLLVEFRSETAFAEKRLALDPELTEGERSKLSAAVASGVPRTVVALDEAQTFLAPGESSAARDIFIRLVKEGRNVGLSCVLATQQPSAIDQKILSQVETFIAHQLVTESDIRAVRDNLKSSLPEEIEYGQRSGIEISALLRELQPGTCLVSASDLSVSTRRCLVAHVRPRGTVHGGVEL